MVPGERMNASIRDARRSADEPAGVELTLIDGRVLHLSAYGVDAHEQQRVQEAVLLALAASGVEVRA